MVNLGAADEENAPIPAPKNKAGSSRPSRNFTVRKLNTNNNRAILLRTSAMKVVNPESGISTLAYALHDTGLQVTLISENLKRELGLKTTLDPTVTIRTLADQKVDSEGRTNLNFFEKHNVFYPSQYGFRKKCSVIHALLDVTTNAYDEIQYKKYTAIMLMDIRKVFDTVSHKILLCKLRHYGIRGPAFSLIENYLSSRSQFVLVNNCSSSSKPISIGVLQGSILGPLLFLIYMNDLYNATLSRPRLFADDTCLMVSEKSISLLEQSCNSELHRLKKLCVANKLQINPDKSVLIYIPFKLNDSLPKLNIAYDDVLVPSNNSSKYLGIKIDSKLNFQPHLKMIENKLARSVGILSKVRFLFPTSTLLLLYFALIHPHLLFGIVLWGSTCSSYQSKLQILQNKAIRII